jgi:RNA polymerase sigma-70 factor (ECF subfamily)
VPVDDTIEELVARVRRGEPRAVDAIVRQHLRAAYAVALAVVRRPTDAEDVAQESLIVAIQRIDTLRDARRFRSWLFQIVRNQALNWRGRQRRDVPPDVPEEPVHDAALPDALAFRFRLLEAMAVLSSTEREVVLLHDLEGWTHVEIAESLAMSVVMSRQHLFQARRKLRTCLDNPVKDVDHE